MTEDSLSHRLGTVMDLLRAAQRRIDDDEATAEVAEAIRELGQMKLAMDSTAPDRRRRHLRVHEEIGTALMVDGREIDAAIVDVSVGGVGLVVGDPLEPGTRMQIAVPPIGWLDAEVVGQGGGTLHIRFLDEDLTEERRRALFDHIMRHYD